MKYRGNMIEIGRLLALAMVAGVLLLWLWTHGRTSDAFGVTLVLITSMGAVLDDGLRNQLRNDVRLFAKKMLGLDLVDWQVEALMFQGDIYVSAGRSAGKSVAAVAYLLWRAMTEPGFTGLYLSGKAQLAAYAASVVKQMIAGKPIERSIVRWSDERIIFDNGSVIYLLPMAESSVRGWHGQFSPGQEPKSLVGVIDEAEIVSERVFQAFLGTLIGSSKNKLMVFGSGGSKTEWWYDLWRSGNDQDPNVKSMMVSTDSLTHTAYVDKKKLKQVMKALPTDQAVRTEIHGEFIDESSIWLPSELVERALVDVKLPVPYSSESVYTLGVDLSGSAREDRDTDRTALVLLERLPTKPVRTRFKSNRERVNQMLVDTGQAEPWMVRLPEDEEVVERPTYRVALVEHRSYLSSVDLERVLARIKREYPSLQDVFVERYAVESLDYIARRIKRPDDPLDKFKYGRMGKGRVDVTVEVVSPSSDNQLEAFSIVRRAFRDGELLIPKRGIHATSLIHELKTFGVGLTKRRGLVRFGTQKGHDDLVYALAWALWGMRRSRQQSEADLQRFYEWSRRQHRLRRSR